MYMNNWELYDTFDIEWARKITITSTADVPPHEMKKAFIIVDVFPPSVGTIQTSTAKLANELMKIGFMTEVATGYLEKRHFYYFNGINLHDFHYNLASPLSEDKADFSEIQDLV